MSVAALSGRLLTDVSTARKGTADLDTSNEPRGVRPIHPLLAVLLAGALPLFLGALLSDLAYAKTYEVQWNNFAQWLLAGAMVFTGLALLGSLIGLFGRRGGGGWRGLCFLLLLAMFAVGLIDSLVHTRDAYGAMPLGAVLSGIVTLLAVAATWAGFSSLRGGARA